MKLYYTLVDNRIPFKILDEIKSDLEKSFRIPDDKFIVNPSPFFRKIKNKMNAIVMNQAEFISKSFQKNLEINGWSYDHTIIGQEIDGYIEKDISGLNTSTISRENLNNQISELDPDHQRYVELISSLKYMYYQRNCFPIDSSFNPSHFTTVQNSIKYRIGLEFETGNIASSFRAFSKLNMLYLENKIDIGIFITSINKKVSTKIWPSSNRNGSLEELENRKFKHELRFPFIIVGFEPDEWDVNCHFLKKDGTRYTLSDNPKKIEFGNKLYLHYEEEDIYKLL